ncbi:hypothetical protein CDQ75_09380, partial [Campylobacter hyointestinalis subsp. hyointestinalis]
MLLYKYNENVTQRKDEIRKKKLKKIKKRKKGKRKKEREWGEGRWEKEKEQKLKNGIKVQQEGDKTVKKVKTIKQKSIGELIEKGQKNTHNQIIFMSIYHFYDLFVK